MYNTSHVNTRRMAALIHRRVLSCWRAHTHIDPNGRTQNEITIDCVWRQCYLSTKNSTSGPPSSIFVHVRFMRYKLVAMSFNSDYQLHAKTSIESSMSYSLPVPLSSILCMNTRTRARWMFVQASSFFSSTHTHTPRIELCLPITSHQSTPFRFHLHQFQRGMQLPEMMHPCLTMCFCYAHVFVALAHTTKRKNTSQVFKELTILGLSLSWLAPDNQRSDSTLRRPKCLLRVGGRGGAF